MHSLFIANLDVQWNFPSRPDRIHEMRVRVLFFGRLKDIVGRSEEDAELSEGARVEDLFARYGRSFPELAQFRPSVVASVNQEFAEWRVTAFLGR